MQEIIFPFWGFFPSLIKVVFDYGQGGEAGADSGFIKINSLIPRCSRPNLYSLSLKNKWDCVA